MQFFLNFEDRELSFLLKKYHPGNWHIPHQGTFEDHFPFPQVGYVSSLEGTHFFVNVDIMRYWGCLSTKLWKHLNFFNPRSRRGSTHIFEWISLRNTTNWIQCLTTGLPFPMFGDSDDDDRYVYVFHCTIWFTRGIFAFSNIVIPSKLSSPKLSSKWQC